jgi:hypothetical protein
MRTWPNYLALVARRHLYIIYCKSSVYVFVFCELFTVNPLVSMVTIKGQTGKRPTAQSQSGH